MKKILALVMALCMMMTALPVLAESAGDEGASGLGSLLSGILGKAGSVEEGEINRLITLISGLKDKLAGNSARFSGILSAVKSRLEKLLSSGEGDIGSRLSGLKDKLGGSDLDLGGILGGLTGGKDVDLGSLLDGLLGGSDQEGDSSIEEDIAETVARLNAAAETEFGDGIPDKKEAESIEEFYGQWVYSKMVFDGEEYDLSGSDDGIFISENTYYSTEKGEKSPDYIHPETAEMKLEKGVLKILIGEIWSVFVLTQEGGLVEVSAGMETYFVRAE